MERADSTAGLLKRVGKIRWSANAVLLDSRQIRDLPAAIIYDPS
jgi:hypothetical protein